MLGAGSFGVVREAVDRNTGRQYACKTVNEFVSFHEFLAWKMLQN